MSSKDPAGQFTDLIQAADKTIPQTCFLKKIPKVPWFIATCKEVIEESSAKGFFLTQCWVMLNSLNF